MVLWEKERERARKQYILSDSLSSLLPPTILSFPLDLSIPFLNSHTISSSVCLVHDLQNSLSLSDPCLNHVFSLRPLLCFCPPSLITTTPFFLLAQWPWLVLQKTINFSHSFSLCPSDYKNPQPSLAHYQLILTFTFAPTFFVIFPPVLLLQSVPQTPLSLLHS